LDGSQKGIEAETAITGEAPGSGNIVLAAIPSISLRTFAGVGAPALATGSTIKTWLRLAKWSLLLTARQSSIVRHIRVEINISIVDPEV